MEGKTSEDNLTSIATSSSLAEKSIRVLKHDEAFAVFNHYGDIASEQFGEEGIYFQGTRHVSHSAFFIDGARPLLLSSLISQDNATLAVDMTNPDIGPDGFFEPMTRGTVHINRLKFLKDDSCHEQFVVTNYGLNPRNFVLELRFLCDFCDIFEVRGFKRSRRGEMQQPEVSSRSVIYRYRGLDALTRETTIEFSQTPDQLKQNLATFAISLRPHAFSCIEIIYLFREYQDRRPERKPQSFKIAYGEAVNTFQKKRDHCCQLITSNEQFNNWINRSLSDVHMMLSETAWGLYPYAGVPWFSAPFGRDGLITAMQMLWLNPAIAKSVLSFLAHLQAVEVSDKNEAEPGKILHETRRGELANLDEIPFRQYYGSVDATPLFIMLAGDYLKRTGDLEFISTIWPNIWAAARWLNEFGDGDGDGFVEYEQRGEEGLRQQGWKDSEDSVFHSNGDIAAAPIALCEVQGYVYAAKLALADMAQILSYSDLSAAMLAEARHLKQKFATDFWLSDENFIALALDRNKKQCRVLASNPGHCLYAGILTPLHAQKVAEKLMQPRFFSGWGIRTVAEGEARYNPMTYHNGTVWPHDNALIAAGLCRYGFKEDALRILTGLFEVSNYVDLNRLPELFCGFPQISGRGPTLYPISCAPQAWAAGSIFMLVAACLGLSIDGGNNRVFFDKPAMPPYLDRLTLTNILVSPGNYVDLELINHRANVGINVLRRSRGVEIISVN